MDYLQALEAPWSSKKSESFATCLLKFLFLREVQPKGICPQVKRKSMSLTLLVDCYSLSSQLDVIVTGSKQEKEYVKAVIVTLLI